MKTRPQDLVEPRKDLGFCSEPHGKPLEGFVPKSEMVTVTF